MKIEEGHMQITLDELARYKYMSRGLWILGFSAILLRDSRRCAIIRLDKYINLIKSI